MPTIHIDRDPAQPGTLVDVAFTVTDWFAANYGPRESSTMVNVRHHDLSPEGEFVATIHRVRNRFILRPVPLPDLDVVVIVAPRDPHDPGQLGPTRVIDPETGWIR